MAGLAWSASFGALHLYWALGGRRGLGSERDNADAALDTAWFAVYNGVVTAACFLAAAVAVAELGTSRRIVRHFQRSLVVVAILLAARGAVGVGGLIRSVLEDGLDTPPILVAVEIYFLAGAFISWLLARRS